MSPRTLLSAAALTLAVALPSSPAEAAVVVGPQAAPTEDRDDRTDARADARVEAGTGAPDQRLGDRADERPMVRLHIDTDFLGYTYFNADDEAGLTPDTHAIGFGVGRLSLIDAGGGPLLFDRAMLALGVGVVLARGRVVVGTRLAFLVDGYLRESGDQSIVAGRFVPYANYMFNPAGRLRPFVGVRVGLGGGAATTSTDVLGDEVRSRFSTIYPIAGAQGGAYIFLADQISLDAGLSVDYAAPFGRTVQLEPDVADADDDFDKIGDAVNLAATLGLSLWF